MRSHAGGRGPRRELRDVAGALRRLAWRSKRAHWSPCWEPMAPARARWPAPSRGWCRHPLVGSGSTGSTSPRRAAHKLSAEGLTHLPEGRGIFPGLTVLENLRMAVKQLTRGERSTSAIDRSIERFPVLGERHRQAAGTLSGGEQQMLALARALAVTPKLIIADEMSLGLAPLVTETVFEGLEEARENGGHRRAHRTVRSSRSGPRRPLRHSHPWSRRLVGPGGGGAPGGHRPVSRRSGAEHVTERHKTTKP